MWGIRENPMQRINHCIKTTNKGDTDQHKFGCHLRHRTSNFALIIGRFIFCGAEIP